MGMLAQCTAEAVLGKINPYVLAVYQMEHQDSQKAVELIQSMLQDLSENSDEGSLYKENYKKIPSWVMHIALGHALVNLSKYDEAIAEFQKVIDLHPTGPSPSMLTAT